MRFAFNYFCVVAIQVLTVPKVEAVPVSVTGSPVHIPTIAVQGIIRDPRAPPRDPRLSATRAGSASNSPTKEMTAGITHAVKSEGATHVPTVSSATTAKLLNTLKSVVSTPFEKAPKPESAASLESAEISTHKSRDRDERSKSKDPRSAKEQTRGSKGASNSNKKVSPSRSRVDKKSIDDKKNASSDRYGSDGRSSRSKSSMSSSSNSRGRRNYHRTNSRSLSPEREKKSVPQRSRSRSPRRSPQELNSERKAKNARSRDLTLHIRDVDKRSRSPEVDVVIVDPVQPAKEEASKENDENESSEPPSKKKKPGDTDSTLPADFRYVYLCSSVAWTLTANRH